jgi:ARG and Rhodanese-Phosphatase-superfamily-associated Protein domain
MPTLLEIEPIATALAGTLADAPRSHGALTVVPLLAPLVTDPGWLTLAEAGDGAQIGEVDEAGSVPHLAVTNRSDRALLLVDGEQLIGAKQNRILNTTVLIPAGMSLTIHVSCVEQGRWGYRSRHAGARHFAASDFSLFASARRKKSDWVSRSLRERKMHMSDQAGIWKEVAAMAAQHGVESATGGMDDFYTKYEADMTAARTALAAIPGQVGAIVYVGGHWSGLELFPGSRLFASAWPRILAGYAADALGQKRAETAVPEPDTLLASLPATPAEEAPAVGLGIEYRLTGAKLSGATLVAEGRLVHLMAFPAPENDGPRKDTGREARLHGKRSTTGH